MSSVSAVLTGISIACIAAGVLLLVAQVRHPPTDRVPPASGNGSEPARRVQPRPAPRGRDKAASGRGEVTRRRRMLSALLVAMVVSLAAALVVRERWVWGVHLFLDDAFLGYMAWLARRAETRARALTSPAGPAPTSDTEVEESGAPVESEAADEPEVTDARA